MLLQNNKKWLPQKGSVTPIKKEMTVQECFKKINITTISRDGMQVKGERRTIEIRLEKLRLDFLFWFSFHKFVEIVTVFVLTLFAIKWTPLFLLLKDAFCQLVGYTLLLGIVLYGLHYIPCICQSLRGCLLIKFICLCCWTGLFFLLAIHVPVLTQDFVHPHFALLAAGTAGITHLLVMLVSVTLKPNARGWGPYLSITIVPTIVVAISRQFYLYFGIGKAYNVDYAEFMNNIYVALIFCLVHTFDMVYVFHGFVSSSQMEAVCRKAGLLPASVSDTQPNSDVESGIRKF